MQVGTCGDTCGDREVDRRGDGSRVESRMLPHHYPLNMIRPSSYESALVFRDCHTPTCPRSVAALLNVADEESLPLHGHESYSEGVQELNLEQFLVRLLVHPPPVELTPALPLSLGHLRCKVLSLGCRFELTSFDPLNLALKFGVSSLGV